MILPFYVLPLEFFFLLESCLRSSGTPIILWNSRILWRNLVLTYFGYVADICGFSLIYWPVDCSKDYFMWILSIVLSK